MEWLKQLSQAIDYIEDHLADEISYDEAAKVACCSTYYFQRVFSYIVGIPLSDYIRRRRMTLAAFELQSSDAKVMDIGSKYGYDSPTSFNRAFQRVHGASPTAARTKGTVLNAYPRISFSISVTGDENLKYRIETKGPIRAVGVKIPLKEDTKENFKIVPSFWDKTLKSKSFIEICKLSNQIPHGVLGITTYNNPKDIYYYVAAATQDSVPEEWRSFSFLQPPGLFLNVKGLSKNLFKKPLDAFLRNGSPSQAMFMPSFLI